LRRGDLIDVEIERLAFGGGGVARVALEADMKTGSPARKFVVFVEGSAPGDRVRARVNDVKRDVAHAATVEVLHAGPDRRPAPCPLVGRCGGCSWQHLNDAAQGAAKVDILRETLERLGGLRDWTGVDVRQLVSAPHPWRYRNKMDLGIGRDGRDPSAPITVGFHRKGDFRSILDVEECLLQPTSFDALVGALRTYARRHQLPGYRAMDHTGVLRNFVLRHSVTHDAVIAVLLTATRDPLPGGFDAFVQELRDACPQLVGVVHGLNAGLADTARVDEELGHWGERWFEERLGAKRFRVSPLSFFQTNTRAAEKLYDVVRDAAAIQPGERLIDAFCGTGTIGLYIGDDAAEIVGLELVREAVADARINAEWNGLGDRARYIEGDVRDTIRQLWDASPDKSRAPAEVLVLDPPRGGLHPKALAGVLSLNVPRLVYVSCNPSTLARDLQATRAAGYRPTSLTPVDMFPQTYHIESVMTFEKE